MTSEDIIRRLAVEQRKRLVASILGYAEREMYGVMNPMQQKAFRDKVLTSVNAYHDFLLDVIRVGGEDVVRNEHAVALIEQVHASQRRLEGMLNDGREAS